MSRVVELHEGWMKDPAFAQEFAKLEEELARLKSVPHNRPTTPALASAKTDIRKTETSLPAMARSA